MIPRKQQIVLSYIAFEFLLLNLCILIAFLIKEPENFFPVIDPSYLIECSQLIFVFNLSWFFVVLFSGDPNFYISYNFQKRIKYLTLNTFLFFGICSFLAIFLKIDYQNRTVFLLPILLFAFLNLFLFRFFLEFFLRRRLGPFESKILVVGAGKSLQKELNFTEKIRPLGYTSIGFLSNKDPELHPDGTNGLNGHFDLNVLGKLKDLPQILDTNPVDEIFINGSALKKKKIRKVIDAADYRGIRVNLIPETILDPFTNFKTSNLENLPLLKHRQTPLDTFNNYLLKKIFDFLFALTVLILLSPVLLLIALLVYMDGKGPVFYTPLRKGESGDTFKCYKFRTMSVCDNPVNGTKSTVENDPRITPIGKYLRKYDLDELPQFFNVLKGDMSVVGPRPHRVHLQKDFRKVVNDYMVRHYVKPGITGLAQVNGWRGPTSTIEQKTERIKYDLRYIENWSFWLDLKIIFLTIFGKKVRKNAF